MSEEEVKAAANFIVNGGIGDNRIGTPEALPGVVPPEVAKHPHLKTHDDFGLSMDPKDWANPNCNECYGRGIVVVTRAVKASDMAPGATGSGNRTTMADPCYGKRCAMKSYWKVRGPLQERVVGIWMDPRYTEEKKLDAIRSTIEEVHKQVKSAGTITDIKALVKVAQQTVEQVIVKPNSVTRLPPPPQAKRRRR